MATSNFPAAVIAAAQASHAFYSPKGPYASVSLAQWAVESAYGHSEPPDSNNPFGIKAVAGQPYVISMTREVINGISQHIPQHFAKYASLTAAFDAHAKLLATSPIYAEAQAATTPETYVRAMAKHYATAPNYADVILAVMRSQDLYQFDLPHSTPSRPAASISPTVGRAPPAPETDMTATINTSPATGTAPARVVPTANQPVRVAWGDWLEQLLVHEEPLIEQAAQTGLSVVAGLIPGGIGTAALNLLGPTVAKDAVDGVIGMLRGPLTSPDATLEVPANNTIATMAANVLNSSLPVFVSRAGAQLDSWVQAAVARL